MKLDDRLDPTERPAQQPDQAEQVVPAEEARPPADARWTRWALAGLLVVTGVGYLWDIGRNGWGNTFYAAAVQAGTHSWTSFFFGSFDWGDHITVDKPPVSLWIMALSGRIFGFSSWSMLAPQALLGVGSVALLHAAVRRVWGAPAGLLAGTLLALTPAAALMFRFNNPDAALTFFLVASAYTLTRALGGGRLRWLLATAVLLGVAFLAKSLQAALVVPGLALAYLWCAPVTFGRRVRHLLTASVVLAVSGLWWPLLVDAIPTASRPYVGGSTNNSVMELIVGLNGVSRITGQEGGPGSGPDGAGRPGGFGGTPGLGRLFNAEFAGFIAWWLPAAAVGLAAGLWLVLRERRHTPLRTDPRLGSLVVWGGWTLVTAAVFSFAGGVVHTYYTVALAPGVAALAGMALPALWRLRHLLVARAFLAASGAATGVTAFLLLGRPPGWQPWLARTVLVAGLVAAVILLTARSADGAGAVMPGRGSAVRRLGAVAGAGALVAGVTVPSVWSVVTIGSTHTGSIPTVGPAAAVARGGFPGTPAGFRRSGLTGRGDGRAPDGPVPGGFPPDGPVPGGFPPDGPVPGGFPRGGPGSAEPVNPEVTALLRAGASGFRWVAAAPGSQTAGPLQLAVDAPVMSLGGFNGGDAAITLDRFKALAAARRIHYFVGGAGFGRGPGDRGVATSITSWVSSTFTSTTMGSINVYDLTKPLASATSP